MTAVQIIAIVLCAIGVACILGWISLKWADFVFSRKMNPTVQVVLALGPPTISFIAYALITRLPSFNLFVRRLFF